MRENDGENAESRNNSLVSLLRRLEHTDEESDWLWFIETQSRILNAVCRRIVKSQHLADDAFQECVIRVRRGLASATFSNDGAAQAWLCTIAANTAKDLYVREMRRLRRQTTIDVDDLQQADAPASEEDDHLLSKVSHAITLLPDRQRHVLELRYKESLSNAQVASRLQLTEHNVRITLARALRRIRSDLSTARRGLPLVPLLWTWGHKELSAASDPIAEHRADHVSADKSQQAANNSLMTLTLGSTGILIAAICVVTLAAGFIPTSPVAKPTTAATAPKNVIFYPAALQYYETRGWYLPRVNQQQGRTWTIDTFSTAEVPPDIQIYPKAKHLVLQVPHADTKFRVPLQLPLGRNRSVSFTMQLLGNTRSGPSSLEVDLGKGPVSPVRMPAAIKNSSYDLTATLSDWLTCRQVCIQQLAVGQLADGQQVFERTMQIDGQLLFRAWLLDALAPISLNLNNVRVKIGTPQTVQFEAIASH